MMKLKLLGVLQDFGSPYASLYRDSINHNMYVAIEQDTIENGVFHYLVFEVSKNLLIGYLNRAVGLREMSKNSQEKYLWSRTKESQGRFTNLGTKDVSDQITQEDTFDDFFCNQKQTICHYINCNL